MRYAGNIIPSIKWTTSSSPERVMQSTTQNKPGLAGSTITITANSQMNGERFVCTMYFEDPLITKENAATNVPNCTRHAVSSALTVHCKYFILPLERK